MTTFATPPAEPPPPDVTQPTTGGHAVVGVDPALWRQLRVWKAERRECRRRDKELTALIDEAQNDLVEQYVAAGTDQIRLDGYTGTLSSAIWARKRTEEVTQAQVAGALRQDGLAHLITPEGYHAQTLSSYLRDLEREGKSLPRHLAELIEPAEVWEVRFTQPRGSRAAQRMGGAGSSVLDGAPSD